MIGLLNVVMLQSGTTVPKVPWHLCDEIRIVRIDHLAILIEIGGHLSALFFLRIILPLFESSGATRDNLSGHVESLDYNVDFFPKSLTSTMLLNLD